MPGDLVEVKAMTTLWKDHPNGSDVLIDQVVLALGVTGVVVTRGDEYVMVLVKGTLGWVSEVLLAVV